MSYLLMEIESVLEGAWRWYVPTLPLRRVQGKLYVDRHLDNHDCDITYDEETDSARIHFVKTGTTTLP